jgi:hypothetical protein
MSQAANKIQGACSVCLRSIQLHGDRPIRHGFTAVGVRHGQSGGRHTGPCPGTRYPHLGISPEGTQWALEGAQRRLARTEERLHELAANPDLTWYPKLRGSYNRASGGLPDLSQPVTLRFAEPEGISYTRGGQPTYASEHRRQVAEQINIKSALKAAIAEYKRVLERWAPEKYSTTGTTSKIETVHMEKPVNTVRGMMLGTLCRGITRGRASSATKTSDPAEVTCKSCRTALGLPTE